MFRDGTLEKICGKMKPATWMMGGVDRYIRRTQTAYRGAPAPNIDSPQSCSLEKRGVLFSEELQMTKGDK